METLVHVDSRDGVDLSESDAVRLVARSAGATSQDDAAVRDVRGHPVPGFAGPDRPTGHPCVTHRVRGGIHYLTRGVSDGSGEWLSSVVVERSAAEPWAPAQLYFSPRWTLGAVAEGEIDPWDGPGALPPALTGPRLRRFLLAEPWAVEALPAVLTMLDDAVARRRPLAIRYIDLDQAMRCLAALGQLLDHDEVWGLEFCLPTADPERGSTAVVGIHAELHPEWGIETSRDLGAHILDLAGRAHSLVEVSPAARRHATWFIDGGADPTRSLAAIALSRRWSDLVDADTASLAVEVLRLRDQNEAITGDEASAIARMLSGFGRSWRDDFEGCAEDLAVRLLMVCEDAGADSVIAMVDALGALSEAGEGAAARTVACAVLELALKDPSVIRLWADAHVEGDVDELPPIEWPDCDEADQVGRLISEIAELCDPEELPQFLRLASPLHADPPLSASLVDRIATQWANAPDQLPSAGWLGRGRAAARLAPLLLERFDQEDLDALHDLRSGAWSWLRDELISEREDDRVAEPVVGSLLEDSDHDRLTAWLELPDHVHAGGPERIEILERVSLVLPERAWVPFLGPANGLDPVELAVWVQGRRRLDRSLSEELVSCLVDEQAPDHGAGRELITELATVGQIEVDHPELGSWIDNDHRVRKLWQRAREHHEAVPNPSLVTLADHHDEVIHLDHGEIVETIHVVEDVATATRIAEPVIDRISDLLRDRLDSELREAQLPALAAALRLMELPDDHWWALAKDSLDEIWDDRALEAVRTELATKAMHLDPDRRRQLALYQQDQAAGRLARNLRRSGDSLADLARAVFRRE